MELIMILNKSDIINVYDQVSYQLRDQVRDQVYDQVSYQVRNRVLDQVYDQVWNLLMKQYCDLK
jgi:hypothetical protein